MSLINWKYIVKQITITVVYLSLCKYLTWYTRDQIWMRIAEDCTIIQILCIFVDAWKTPLPDETAIFILGMFIYAIMGSWRGIDDSPTENCEQIDVPQNITDFMRHSFSEAE